MRCTTFQTVCLLPAYVEISLPLPPISLLCFSTSLTPRLPHRDSCQPCRQTSLSSSTFSNRSLSSLFIFFRSVRSLVSLRSVRYAPLGCVCVRVCSALTACDNV